MIASTVIIYKSMDPVPAQNLVASPSIDALDAEFVTLQMPLPTPLVFGKAKIVDLEFQAAFLHLLDYRPATQIPTDADLKPKLRYRFPG